MKFRNEETARSSKSPLEKKPDATFFVISHFLELFTLRLNHQLSLNLDDNQREEMTIN